jgi:hypothetical protein
VHSHYELEKIQHTWTSDFFKSLPKRVLWIHACRRVHCQGQYKLEQCSLPIFALQWLPNSQDQFVEITDKFQINPVQHEKCKNSTLIHRVQSYTETCLDFSVNETAFGRRPVETTHSEFTHEMHTNNGVKEGLRGKCTFV